MKRTFDEDGFDRHGFDHKGRHRNGTTFGDDGFDYDGIDIFGRNRAGFNEAGFDKDGFDGDGFDRAGFNRSGLTKDGLDMTEVETLNQEASALLGEAERETVRRQQELENKVQGFTIDADRDYPCLSTIERNGDGSYFSVEYLLDPVTDWLSGDKQIDQRVNLREELAGLLHGYMHPEGEHYVLDGLTAEEAVELLNMDPYLPAFSDLPSLISLDIDEDQEYVIRINGKSAGMYEGRVCLLR